MHLLIYLSLSNIKSQDVLSIFYLYLTITQVILSIAMPPKMLEINNDQLSSNISKQNFTIRAFAFTDCLWSNLEGQNMNCGWNPLPLTYPPPQKFK